MEGGGGAIAPPIGSEDVLYMFYWIINNHNTCILKQL